MSMRSKEWGTEMAKPGKEHTGISEDSDFQKEDVQLSKGTQLLRNICLGSLLVERSISRCWKLESGKC